MHNVLPGMFGKFQKAAFDDFTVFSLRAVIILWAIFLIVLVLNIQNKWILAGILAYEVLP